MTGVGFESKCQGSSEQRTNILHFKRDLTHILKVISLNSVERRSKERSRDCR